MAATTVRLPDSLKLEADAYAHRLGISLNALLAVALRDYLDGRTSGVSLPGPDEAVSAPKPVRAPKRLPAKAVLSGAARRAPCPCGSGKQYRHCHERVSAAHPAP